MRWKDDQVCSTNCDKGKQIESKSVHVHFGDELWVSSARATLFLRTAHSLGPDDQDSWFPTT